MFVDFSACAFGCDLLCCCDPLSAEARIYSTIIVTAAKSRSSATSCVCLRGDRKRSGPKDQSRDSYHASRQKQDPTKLGIPATNKDGGGGGASYIFTSESCGKYFVNKLGLSELIRSGLV